MEYPEMTVFQLDSLEWIRGNVFCVYLISFERVFEQVVSFPEIGTNFLFLMAGQFEYWFRFVKKWLLWFFYSFRTKWGRLVFCFQKCGSGSFVACFSHWKVIAGNDCLKLCFKCSRCGCDPISVSVYISWIKICGGLQSLPSGFASCFFLGHCSKLPLKFLSLLSR